MRLASLPVRTSSPACSAGLISLLKKDRHLLSVLHVVVLPIIVALLATTLLLPPVRALKRRGATPAASVALVMGGATLLLAAVIAGPSPSRSRAGCPRPSYMPDGHARGKLVISVSAHGG